jgi:hypothetical protein
MMAGRDPELSKSERLVLLEDRMQRLIDKLSRPGMSEARMIHLIQTNPTILEIGRLIAEELRRLGRSADITLSVTHTQIDRRPRRRRGMGDE